MSISRCPYRNGFCNASPRVRTRKARVFAAFTGAPLDAVKATMGYRGPCGLCQHALNNDDDYARETFAHLMRLV